MAPSPDDGRAKVDLAVDLVVLTVGDDELRAVLVRRRFPPFEGRWALPGGFVLSGEDVIDAALRELDEETGVRAQRAHVEQLATYARPDRDPRGRVVSVAHLVLLPELPPLAASGDAAEVATAAVEPLLSGVERLAFDHRDILSDGVERARSKLEYTPLGAAFCPEEFTIAELRRVYEAVWGRDLDPRNFHRKVTRTPGFVEATPGSTTRDGGRPARLYRAGAATVLHPAMLRPSAHDEARA